MPHVQHGDLEFVIGGSGVLCLVCQSWFQCSVMAEHLNSWKHFKKQVRAVIAELDAYLRKTIIVLDAMD